MYTFTLSVSPPLCLYVPVCLPSVCPPACLSVCSNQLSQHDEKERLMEADRANSDLHICVICMKSLMNTSVSGGRCCASYMHWRLGTQKHFSSFHKICTNGAVFLCVYQPNSSSLYCIHLCNPVFTVCPPAGGVQSGNRAPQRNHFSCSDHVLWHHEVS